MMSNNWNATVNELLMIFKGAIIAIIPWLEKAKIRWKEGEAYDDCDNIFNSLYENIVLASLTGEVLDKYPIAKYGFQYVSYSELDFIIIKSKEYNNKRLAFVSFESLHYPLDSVKAASLDNEDLVTDFLILNVEGLEFSLAKNKNGDKEIISEVKVIL